MKKLILAGVALFLYQTAMASGGSNLTFKNSAAGFIHESLEHSLRVMIQSEASTRDMVTDASVVTTSPDDSVVTITLNDGSSMIFNCVRFDDWSKGGTVLKKEVTCRAN